MPMIGIDLGSTNSFVAVSDKGKITVIENDFGNRKTPSCVAFTPEGLMIGEEAIDQMQRNWSNTITGFKRLLGEVAYEKLTKESEKWPSKLEKVQGRLGLKVQQKGIEKFVTAEMMAAIVLSKMKENAEKYMNDKVVTGAVITVPASYNYTQRRAIINAASIAGITTAGLLNEPTAAAIAYALKNQNKTEQNEYRRTLIFRLGGGTHDVVVLNINGNIFEIKSAAGSCHLGGDDFTEGIFTNLARIFEERHNIDPVKNIRAIAKLRNACEKAKKDLSVSEFGSVQIDELINRIDFEYRFSNTDFENWNEENLGVIRKAIYQALLDAHTNEKEIQDVVVVGAATRMPCIQEMLKGYFSSKIRKIVNVDEAAAEGAAALAANLCKTVVKKDKIVIHDIIAHSLPIKDDSGQTIGEIERGSNIPLRMWFDMEQMKHKISFRIQDTRYTSKHDISAANVCFRVDEDGLLKVKAYNQSGKKVPLDDRGPLPTDVDRMVKELKEFEEGYQKQRDAVQVLSQLQENISEQRKRIPELGDGVESLRENCEEIIRWIEETPNALVADIKQKSKDLEKIRKRIDKFLKENQIDQTAQKMRPRSSYRSKKPENSQVPHDGQVYEDNQVSCNVQVTKKALHKVRKAKQKKLLHQPAALKFGSQENLSQQRGRRH